MLIYSKENINKIYFTPWCEYRFDNDKLRLYNNMQKKEIVLDIRKESAIELIKLLNNGIEQRKLLNFFKEILFCDMPKEIIIVLLANGIIE